MLPVNEWLDGGMGLVKAVVLSWGFVQETLVMKHF